MLAGRNRDRMEVGVFLYCLQAKGGVMPPPSVSAVVAQVRQAWRPVLAFATTVTVGILGYVLLANIGVVEAVFWLVDPTSIELHFQTHAGPERLTKGFAVLVVTALLLSGLWIGETVLETAFDGQLSAALSLMQQQERIEKLENHVVVCGYGMFGQTVADRLRAAGRAVVVVERDESVFERAADTGLAVRGDAREETVLADAGIERASALVAAIDDSNANVQISIVASQLAPDLRLVVRVGDEMYESLAKRAGADEVIIPEVVSGTEASELLSARPGRP